MDGLSTGERSASGRLGSMIGVQRADYPGEDDIVPLEGDFGRV